MPFTFAHPSIVLPLKSKYFNFSGLILGSMAPDLIYFVLFSPSSNLGHRFWGFLLFNLPMCFLLNYLFYKYIQELFICTLPNFISKKYMYIIKNKNMLLNKRDILIFTYSCLIGMVTHVLWDGFTHNTGFFVQNMKFLSGSITLFYLNIPVYKILQHGSTLVGFFIIFVYIYKNRDTMNRKYYLSINKRKICLSIIFITLILTISFIIFFLNTRGFVGIGRIIVTFINSLFLSYLVIGFAYSNKLFIK